MSGKRGKSTTVNYVYENTTWEDIFSLAAGFTQVLEDETNVYLYGVGWIGEEQPDGWQYYLGDALGSVRQLTNEAGEITLAKSYLPYGEAITGAGGAASAYGYTGEWADQYTNLVYLRARWYAPLDGRFLSKDVWPGDYARPLSLNAWLHGFANPIKYLDPSGRCPVGTCGPDVTEWLMSQMKSHYTYGVRIAALRLLMHARAFMLDPVFPSPLFAITTETPYREIVNQIMIPGLNIPIGMYPVNSGTAYYAIDALGVLEYAAYGLAVDYARLTYPLNADCDQGCSEVSSNNKTHRVVTLCDHCIDVSDMGNMMFGLGGAVRGYELPFTYISASTYNVLNDWIPNRENDGEGFWNAFFSPDGKGAIPGWLIGKSGAFLNSNLFCAVVNSTRGIGYNENDDLIGRCGACSSTVGKIIVEAPSSLIRVSRYGGGEGTPVLIELQEKINSLFR